MRLASVNGISISANKIREKSVVLMDLFDFCDFIIVEGEKSWSAAKGK